jgi:hypothetical protein
VGSSQPFNRWGRVVTPEWAVGTFLKFARGSSDGWKVPPPADAIRLWMLRPGAPEDHDDNWTMRLHESDVSGWLTDGGFVIADWLPEGQEPGVS